MAARISEHRAAREQAREERNQRRGDRAMVAADVARIEQQLPLAEQRLAAFEELGREDLVPRLRVAEVEQSTMRQDLIVRRAELGRAAAAEAEGECGQMRGAGAGP